MLAQLFSFYRVCVVRLTILLMFMLLTHAIFVSSYDREAQYDFLRPCLQDIVDDDGKDDVSGAIVVLICYLYHCCFAR